MPFRTTCRHTHSAEKRQQSPPISRCRLPWRGLQTGGSRPGKRYQANMLHIRLLTHRGPDYSPSFVLPAGAEARKNESIGI